jgi:hypothetical protein
VEIAPVIRQLTLSTHPFLPVTRNSTLVAVPAVAHIPGAALQPAKLVNAPGLCTADFTAAVAAHFAQAQVVDVEPDNVWFLHLSFHFNPPSCCYSGQFPGFAVQE